MTRKTILIALFSLALGGLRAETRPNFLFILADDQSPFTLRAYGNTVCQTPHIDRLAREGMTLDAAYHMGSWSGAVCTPSRHMIMLGRTLWHLPGQKRGVRSPRERRQRDRDVATPDGSGAREAVADPAQESLPAVFNRAGYETYRTCKRGNSYEGANRLFSVREDATKRGGAAETGSAWHGDRALEFLEQHARQKEKGDHAPFFIYLGFSHPHDTRDGTPELLAKYGARNVKSPPTEVDPRSPPLPLEYLPAHPFPHGHPGLRDEVKVSGVGTSRSEATVRNETGREYACIENIDIQVGRVLARLDELDELDQTYIVYTADHGMSVGRHGLMGKQNLYEHTWRVPFIVRGPGIAAGKRAPGNTYLLDVLPTFCELAKVPIPATVEGLSFAPVLRGERETVRDVLYGAYCGGTKPGIRAVRRGKWKLIKYDVLDGAVRETQLFDLEANPLELLREHAAEDVVALTGGRPRPEQRNLADDPKHAETRKELEALLLAEQARLDDPYRLQDQPPATERE